MEKVETEAREEATMPPGLNQQCGKKKLALSKDLPLYYQEPRLHFNCVAP